MKTDSPIKEQSLHPATAPRPQAKAAAQREQFEDLDSRIKAALQAASDKKAIHTVLLDLREIASFTDYFIITSGMNERQVQAISDEIFEKLKHAGSPAARVEGYKTAEWILLDFGDFVVHVFEDKARKFYDLERLWRESTKVGLPPQLSGEVENTSSS